MLLKLPIELVHLISWFLPFGTLSVCSRLTSVYKSNWYIDYLKYRFLEYTIPLDSVLTAKRLYYRSIQQGPIYYLDRLYSSEFLPREIYLATGIKAASVGEVQRAGA